MKSFVLCRDNPYMAVSKPDGSFEIPKFPAGELEFQFWHEEAGHLAAKPTWLKGRSTFTIKAGETTNLGEIGEKKDPVGHNFNINPAGESEGSSILEAGLKIRRAFKSCWNIPTPVVCNIHGWMKGFVLCRDNPYMAVTKPDGSFEIKMVPAGELEFQFWHEEAGYLLAMPE